MGLLRPSLQFTLRFFVPDNEMNDAIRRGHEEPIEIFPQLFHFIPPRNTVYP
jgi:hypothetical protein